MRPPLIAAVAGIPRELGQEFIGKFKRSLQPTSILSWLPLEFSEAYTDSYASKLYEHLASKLKREKNFGRYNTLSNANCVLLYVEKEDGRESVLFCRFGVEALVVPLKLADITSLSLATSNQQGRAVNKIVREGNSAIKRAQPLLSVIAEEVTNRDNRTCLLLPRKNFGRDIRRVLDCVRDAALDGLGSDQFKREIDLVSGQLRTTHKGEGTYFVGRSDLIFKSPGKARGRHGLAPAWGAPGHESSCVIRGRMRFGASFDPEFHYDCAITRETSRRFPSCHGKKSISRERRHVNIAPNDNIR